MSLIQLQVKEEKREELINDSEMPSGEPATLSQHTITEEMPPQGSPPSSPFPAIDLTRR